MPDLETSLDWRILPTPEEVQNIKESVNALELQLQEAKSTLSPAQHIIASIERQIFKRNAWIASIRRLPYEILPIIFLEVCKMDWSAPLTLRQVCRSWRDAIDTTPAAWSFIPFSKCRSYQHGSAFFTRSAPCVVHNTIPSRADAHVFEILSEVAGRTQCLTVHGDRLSDLKRYTFPILERLKISGLPTGNLPDENIAFMLKSNHFPKLRSFNAASILDLMKWTSIPITNFVLLQDLRITVGRSKTWVKVLEHCCSSLKSLSVSLRPPDGNFNSGEPTTIFFPLLKFLSIDYWAQKFPITWAIDAQTPVLHTYQEMVVHAVVSNRIHRDTEVVKSLFFMTQIDLSMFPQLRDLQFWPTGLPSVLDMLSNPGICPNVATIIHTGLGDTDIAHTNEVIAARNRLTGANIQFVPARRDGLYGDRSMEFPCGSALPCEAVQLHR